MFKTLLKNMTKWNFLCLFFLCLIFGSCGSDSFLDQKNTQFENNAIEVKAIEVKNLLTLQKIDLSWVAYKTSEKIPVEGVFSQVKVNFSSDLKYLNKLSFLEQLEFLIPVNGLDTKNPDRDAKILKYFFGNLRYTNEISGAIQKINLEDQTLEILLIFNDLKQTVTMNYIEKEKEIIAETVLFLKDFEALKALSALNQVCYDLHKGADGKSILWEEVAVKVVFLYE